MLALLFLPTLTCFNASVEATRLGPMAVQQETSSYSEARMLNVKLLPLALKFFGIPLLALMTSGPLTVAAASHSASTLAYARLPWPSNDSIQQATGACDLANVKNLLEEQSALLGEIAQGSSNGTVDLGPREDSSSFTAFWNYATEMDGCHATYQHPLYLVVAGVFYTMAGLGYDMTSNASGIREAVESAYRDFCLVESYDLPEGLQAGVETSLPLDRKLAPEIHAGCDLE